MSKDREVCLKDLLRKIITEQGQGCWYDDEIEKDVNLFFDNLWEEFKSDT